MFRKFVLKETKEKILRRYGAPLRWDPRHVPSESPLNPPLLRCVVSTKTTNFELPKIEGYKQLLSGVHLLPLLVAIAMPRLSCFPQVSINIVISLKLFSVFLNNMINVLNMTKKTFDLQFDLNEILVAFCG